MQLNPKENRVPQIQWNSEMVRACGSQLSYGRHIPPPASDSPCAHLHLK